MEAVSGQTFIVGGLGFVFSAGFHLFKAADDQILGRVVYGQGDSTLRAIARVAAREGARTAIAVGGGTAIAKSIDLYQRERLDPAAGHSGPVGTFFGTLFGSYVMLESSMPWRRRAAVATCAACAFSAAASISPNAWDAS